LPLVDELEQRRLVRRRRNSADGRLLDETTPLGLKTQLRATKLLDECERHFLTPLTVDEQQQVHALLGPLVAHNPPRG
jgi:DNA-binding MarR family transcriptional regulator